VVPARRVAELARYGLAAKAPALRRLPHARRVATVPATVRWLGGQAVDDALTGLGDGVTVLVAASMSVRARQ